MRRPIHSVNALEVLKQKCEEIVTNAKDIHVDSVGRFYKPAVAETTESGIPDIRVEFVLDPPDRRGKGCVPSMRKGYRKSKKRKGTVQEEAGLTQQLFA